ncbi:MAG: FAD:protein FMN transferase [Pseudomonadota bacterium]
MPSGQPRSIVFRTRTRPCSAAATETGAAGARNGGAAAGTSLVAALVLGLSSCSGGDRAQEARIETEKATEADEQPIVRTHYCMGTEVTIQLLLPNQVVGQADHDTLAELAIQEAFFECDRLERLMTTRGTSGSVTRINESAGSATKVTVDPEVLEVIDRALEISRVSAGAFDITVGALGSIWRFDLPEWSVPSQSLVESQRRLVSWRDVVVSHRDRTVRLRRTGQRITLGGIAKGYAVDKSAQVLTARGFRDFVIRAGGDLYASGRKGNRQWRVGIRFPRGARDQYFAFVDVEDRTVSTSGDYERYVVRDGQRYHHLLDPATGYPAGQCQSATVIATSALTADALSTALFVLGPDRGMDLLRRFPGTEAVFVDSHGKVTVSPGLRLESQPGRAALRIVH